MWSDIQGSGGPSPNRRDVSACHQCVQHQEWAGQRNDEHIAAWDRVVQAHDAANEAVIAQLRNEARELRAELEDRPVKEVLTYVDIDELKTAKAEADRAFRSRDYAYRSLSELRLLHRPGVAGKCRCGKRSDMCEEAQLLQGLTGLDHWERRQVEQLQRGFHHELPSSHPAIIDPRWQGWGN